MEERVVTVEKVVFGGKGLSRDLQKVTLIPLTLPGEKVRIRITREHRDYLEAEALEIVEPSPDRRSPDCRYFGTCGGCQISHASYPAQVRLKESILKETLRRNRIEIPEIQVFTAAPFGYRQRARLKYDFRQKRLGFHETGSNRIVDIQECLCLTPGLNQLLTIIRQALPAHQVPNLGEIDCYENDAGETFAFFHGLLPESLRSELQRSIRVRDASEASRSPWKVHFRNIPFPIRPDIFLQVNPNLWNGMVQEVESHHEDGLDRIALELYCGAGFLTMPLAAKFRKIIACEENSAAIRFAAENCPNRNIEWVCSPAEKMRFPSDATAAIVDPPRAGLHKKVIEEFRNRPFHKITYVSCDCSSFARDVKALEYRYRLSRLSLMDLFPQTYHFEIIALLESRVSQM